MFATIFSAVVHFHSLSLSLSLFVSWDTRMRKQITEHGSTRARIIIQIRTVAREKMSNTVEPHVCHLRKKVLIIYLPRFSTERKITGNHPVEFQCFGFSAHLTLRFARGRLTAYIITTSPAS
jgi:hypothetical protein